MLTGCEIVQKLFVPIRLLFPEVMVPEHSLSSPPELLPARIVLVMLTVPELRLAIPAPRPSVLLSTIVLFLMKLPLALL